ncbi:DNA repair metallo-beta-lactamase-domain-containing protein [Blyttiomyces helicus]|uniref:DNA repair metallo-beta-lactamase-domain-containing protein n=1 Tax=Blyttiomyces helicus TaxID=388810 RepID=A0A4P9W6Y3_9FUNG|nr:DNA repair metallo-beta-lactamase-domain-containing protein [Blyttiomyces helicus]|eukprot:RKO88219.1 DNA repair metallo-beta-lactamase-domain-containing protein [Blyttiomyces helicus]
MEGWARWVGEARKSPVWRYRWGPVGVGTSKRIRAAPGQLCAMGQLRTDKLESILSTVSKTYTHILALRPTGWTFRRGPSPTASSEPFTTSSLTPTHPSPRITLVGVPYSEHSSFTELAAFVKGARPVRVIPTVFGGGKGAGMAEVQKWCDLWLSEVREGGTAPAPALDADFADEEVVELLEAFGESEGEMEEGLAGDEGGDDAEAVEGGFVCSSRVMISDWVV